MRGGRLLRLWAAGIFVAAGFGNMVAPAHAGTIGFTIKTTIELRDGIDARVELQNTGDEAAFDVTPSVTIAQDEQRGEAERRIPAGGRRTWTLRVRPEIPSPGNYVAVVRVRYEDANGYPFEVISTTPFSHRAKRLPPVRGQFTFPALRQNDSAKGVLLLTIPERRGERFRIDIVLPAGLRAERTEYDVAVPASRRVRLPIEVRNRTLLPGSVVNAFALISSSDEANPQTDVIQGAIRVVAPRKVFEGQTWTALALALVLYALTLEAIRGRESSLAVSSERSLGPAEWLLAAVPTGFLLSIYPWDALLADTITAGGDMASLFYPTKLMAEEILPSGQVTGWTMGNYAGFPVFHFYSTLPFVIIALLGHIVPMTIAFKLVTLLGPTFLPLAAAYLFRRLGYGAGAAALAAASTLPFLLQQGNSMWGGNIPSVLAGEFCHAIGLTLSLVFLGMLHRLQSRPDAWPLAGILLAAIGLCHTFAFFAAVWFSLFFLWPRRDVAVTAPPVLALYGVTVLLLCFWGLPIPARLVYTSEWSMIWRIKDWTEVLPKPLWPAAALAAANIVLMAVRLKSFRTDTHGLLLFAFGGGIVLYFLVPAIGFPDIRFIPVAQIFLGLLAADFVYWMLQVSRERLLLVAAIVVGVLAWGQAHLGYIPSWLKWNYAGYEGKNTWSQFKEINDHVRGDMNDPRVVFEHSQAHNRFGSSRAFENLPLFSGRATLEGVFHQASHNSPFIFYLQSEASERGSGPFPQYTYTRLNPAEALPHFRLYNVSQIIVVSEKAREAYDDHPAYERSFQSGAYAVYDIAGGDTGYVVAARNQPVLYDGPNWKIAFMRWFKHHELNDIPLVPAELIPEAEAREFTLRTDAIERLPRRPIVADCNVRSRLDQYRITIDTSCPRLPHIVKVSYFPRWRTDDGSRLLPVSPGFMLVYPKDEHVELIYGRNLVDWIGLALTVLGIAAVLTLLVRREWAGAVLSSVGTSFSPALRMWGRHRVVLSTILIVAAASGAVATRIVLRAPERAYAEAQEAYRARDFERAVELFTDWVATDRDTFKQATALYQLGVSHSELGNYAAAIEIHERLRFQFPNVDYGAGTLFHLARNHVRLGMIEKARAYARELAAEHQGTSWLRRLQKEYPQLFNDEQR